MATAQERAAAAKVDWAYFSRVSGWHTYFFGRILDWRTLNKRQAATLEKKSYRLAKAIADYEFGRDTTLTERKVNARIARFYKFYKLRIVQT